MFDYNYIKNFQPEPDISLSKISINQALTPYIPVICCAVIGLVNSVRNTREFAFLLKNELPYIDRQYNLGEVHTALMSFNF